MRIGEVQGYGFGGYGKGRIAGLPEESPVPEVIVYVAKRPGPDAPKGPGTVYNWRGRKGMTGLRLDVESALVVADLLATLGNEPAAVRILRVLDLSEKSTFRP